MYTLGRNVEGLHNVYTSSAILTVRAVSLKKNAFMVP